MYHYYSSQAQVLLVCVMVVQLLPSCEYVLGRTGCCTAFSAMESDATPKFIAGMVVNLACSVGEVPWPSRTVVCITVMQADVSYVS